MSRDLRLGLAAAAAAALASCSSDRVVPVEGLPVREAVLAFVGAQQDDGRSTYSAPSQQAARDLASAVVALGEGDLQQARDGARPHSYEVVPLADGVLALVPSRLPDDRGWGLYVVRPGGRELALEVPHPRDDLDTEDLGARLASTTRARYLLVAGAERRAADVARAQEAVFTAVHRALAEQGVPALQLHGFAADSLPDVDLVVSPGSSPTSPLARAIADAGSDAGLGVCRAWEQECGRLEGRRNVQGLASREAGTPFVHLEVTRALRRDDRREGLVRLITEAVEA